ncbi:MAG TPA: hypothetical protein VHM00_00555 [Caldimonas sp.]|jgi:hypothetical protein|nr:hypothetical protein [Caldimonas sp.]HEX2539553.1 hypothetical protein [Caldimonas sp.]
MSAGPSNHVPREALLDYWLHESDPAATDAIDEHLMDCEPCGRALDELVALGDAVRAAFRSGAVSAMASDAFLQRLVAGGVHVREYRLPRNGSVNCTVGPDDELLVAHLETDLRGVERLDAVVTLSLEPDVQHRLHDVPFDAHAGEVLWLPKFGLVRSAPAHVAEVTLLSVGAAGSEELGRYTFRHQPWPPRPAPPG